MPEEQKTGKDTSTAEFLETLIAAKERLKEKPAEIRRDKTIPHKEKIIIKPIKKIPSGPLPPIYKRALPQLPPPPRYTEAWPLPAPPRPPARPPEAEAFAPRMMPIPEPVPPAMPVAKPAPRPVIIRPAPGAAPKLDLGNLNPLIADETIATIQCDGANLPLKITKERRVEEISIVLSEEEIKSIIKSFSEASGQAITEPVFKVSVAGFTFSAVISAFSGSKFVIARY